MRFINANYDKDLGKSIAIVEHNKQFFTGVAKAHPDDKEHASEYRGCSLAETRAMIAALRDERKKLVKETETCRKFIKACSCHKNWNKEESSAKIAYHQLNVRIKAINKLSDRINALYAGLLRSIKEQEKVHNILKMNKRD